MNLSPHFTLAELTLSQTAARLDIDNRPSIEIIESLRRTADLLEGVRRELANIKGREIGVLVSSGYRCAELNGTVGGARDSAHVRGLAADFIAPSFGPPYDVACAIRDSDLAFDQLIYEFGRWVHIGLAVDGVQPRRQLLTYAKPGWATPGIVVIAGLT